MDTAPSAKRSRRKPWLIAVCLAAVVAVALVAVYGTTGRRQAAGPADQDKPAEAEPRFTPTPSQATMAPSSAPIPGLTLAAFESKLPASWKAEPKPVQGAAGLSYSTTSTTALTGAHLLLNIDLNHSNQPAQLKSISCQLKGTGLKPDPASVGVLNQCLRAAMPPVDAQRAVSWLDNTAIGLSGRADLRSFDTGGFTIYLEHFSLGGLVVIVKGATQEGHS